MAPNFANSDYVAVEIMQKQRCSPSHECYTTVRESYTISLMLQSAQDTA
jgi:hypothetical protein